MARIFITSATGYIGEAVAKALKKRGHQVTALVRSDKSEAKAKQHGCETVRGDIKDPKTYASKLKEFDGVIHTAADYGPEFAKSESETVEMVGKELENTNKVFIYTSGIWVLGNTGDTPANESAPANSIDLVKWRVGVENNVLAQSRKGVRSMVLRPGIVYGNGGGIFAMLIDTAKKASTAMYIGTPDSRWSLVHVDDLGELYALAFEKGKAGSLYHGVESQPVKASEYSKLVAEIAGVPGKTKALSVEEAKPHFGPWSEGLGLDQHVTAPKTNTELGWTPKPRKLADELKSAPHAVPTGR